jgi:uncharacterized protein (TIGR02001 family)
LNRATGVAECLSPRGEAEPPYTAAASKKTREIGVVSHLSPARARWLPGLLLALGTAPVHAVELGSNFTLGGDLAVTSDYIYRGVSESDGHGAVQGDLHLESTGGTFIGVWSSTRDHHFDPYADYDLELYLGHRFALTSAWSATLSARSHYFVGGNQEQSADYQELSVALTYLDRWTLEVAAIPNAVQYWFDLRLGRTPAWVADTAVQWQLRPPGLFVTGGAGYYYTDGTGSGIAAGGGYAYGNGGLAYEHRPWRVDVGYFLTQGKAREFFPYPLPSNRVAGTLTWRF